MSDKSAALKTLLPLYRQLTSGNTFVGLVTVAAVLNVVFSSLWLGESLDQQTLARRNRFSNPEEQVEKRVAIVLREEGQPWNQTQIWVRNTCGKNVTVVFTIELFAGKVNRIGNGWGKMKTDVETHSLIVNATTSKLMSTVHGIRSSKSHPTQALKLWSDSHKAASFRYKIEWEAFVEPRTTDNDPWAWGGSVVGGAEGFGPSPVEYRRFWTKQASHHTAAHGIFFDVEAKDAPIMISGLRTSGLAGYQRFDSTPPSHFRVYVSNPRHKDAKSHGHGKEWRMIGEDRHLQLPVVPELGSVPMEPIYLPANNKITFMLHSEFPFGVSVKVPTIEALKEDVRDYFKKQVSFVPDWLLLAFDWRITGLEEDEWIRIYPGRVADAKLRTQKGLHARSFMGMLEYRELDSPNGYDLSVAHFYEQHGSHFNFQRNPALASAASRAKGSLTEQVDTKVLEVKKPCY